MSAADTLKLVGRTIAEKYAVECVVGEGGFATVYRATHLLWKRPVALKVFKALGDFSEKDRQRLLDEFVQEGALLADLSARTAAIVQARDIAMLETEAGLQVPYMVLEWLEGATLEAVFTDERSRGLPPRTIAEVVALLDPASEALALAHRKGIAHRDIKPGNLFVIGDPRGECTVKLLDFGIAKVVADVQKMAGSFTKTSGHVTSFTPAYGAPEQFSRSHGSTGPWTDVFSLALVVTEAITGHEPLQGDDFLQLAVASAHAERRPTPRALGAAVSDEVEAVFAKALAVNPRDRWQTAGEFWNKLRHALRLDPMLWASTDTGRRSVLPTHSPPLATAATVSVESPLTTGAPAAATAKISAPSSSNRVLLIVGLAGTTFVLLGAGAVWLQRSKSAASKSADFAASAAATPLPPPAALMVAPAPCPDGMLRIPGGSFFMGSDEGLPLEKPAHQVLLEPYCMDRFEVTVDSYKACSDAGRCKRAGTTNEWADITEKEHKAFDPLCNSREPAAHGHHPVNCVDWEMAEKFCHEARGGRLPTEAEWEFAARGPDGRKYPWGDDDPAPGLLNACGKECVAWGSKQGVDQRAMYDADDGFPTTAPVGSFPRGASRYGLEDVVGNVWEWVHDWYGKYDPAEQKAPSGPQSGDERVIRGGGWNGSYASWVRPTFRYKDAPTKRSHGIGFRCAR